MAELFDIDHETGDLSQYDSTVTDGGDLSVTAAAALAGTNYGLQCLIDDGNSIYGQKNQADTGTRKLRFRFYFDRNTLSLLNGTGVYVIRTRANIAPWWLMMVSLETSPVGAKQIYVVVYDDNGYLGSNLVSSGDSHYVECYILQASSDVAADGSYEWWLDGVLKKIWANVDNYDLFDKLEYIRIGAISPAFGASGILYLDQLKANDDGSEIGEHIAAAASRHGRPVIKIEGAERLYGLRRHAIW